MLHYFWATLYREGTKWANGNIYALMGHLALHIRALISTAEPGNCPREPFSLPLKGHSPGRWNEGAGGRLLPKNPTPRKCPFSILEVYFLSKTCPYFVEEKDRFPQYACSYKVCFFAHYGARLHREGTELAKGHIYALVVHLTLHN